MNEQAKARSVNYRTVEQWLFLEITTEHQNHLEIPGRSIDFENLEMAQAQGDFEVLTTQRGRRGLRLHVKGNLSAGLRQISALTASALNLQ